MTPERIREIDSVARQYPPDDRIDSDKLLWLAVDKRAGFHQAEEIELMTWGELRALLAAHGNTCEWHEMADGSLITGCGRTPLRVATHATRPCWCGGRVVIRGQKEK